MENCLLKGSTHRCRGVTHGMNRTWSTATWTVVFLPVIAFTSPIENAREECVVQLCDVVDVDVVHIDRVSMSTNETERP